MSNKSPKAPRKAYAKPMIAVEDFTLNQFIASCTIKTRDNPIWEDQLKAYDPLYYKNYLYMKSTNQFIDEIGCTIKADTDMDTLCYHSSTSPLLTS